MEALIDSGPRRARHEGGGLRLRRYFSMPQVKISMEDKEPIDHVARLWGRKTTPSGYRSTGNKVWGVQIGGKKAKELLRLMMPYLAGPKRKKALFLLHKHRYRTTLPVPSREGFIAFRGLL